MDRRQALQYGFQRFRGILPAILSAAGGIEGWLKEKEISETRVRPACFAGNRKKQIDLDDRKKNSKEEQR